MRPCGEKEGAGGVFSKGLIVTGMISDPRIAYRVIAGPLHPRDLPLLSTSAVVAVAVAFVFIKKLYRLTHIFDRSRSLSSFPDGE